MSQKIFISYSHQDSICAQGIARFLLKTILMELRDCLTLAEDTMRQADQQLPSQLRDILF